MGAEYVSISRIWKSAATSIFKRKLSSFGIVFFLVQINLKYEVHVTLHHKNTITLIYIPEIPIHQFQAMNFAEPVTITDF